jgi:hypothetical protein
MGDVVNPPLYYFSGINFNPAFYVEQSQVGFTETQANGLYLRKTVPDTAGVLETFSNRIKTNSVDGTATNSTIRLGSNLVSGGIVSIGSSTSTVNIKTQDGASNIVNIKSGSSITGNVNIGTFSSSPFPIGTPITINGAVDIGNALTTSNIKGELGINTETSNNTMIGNSLGTITINQPLIMGYTSYPTDTTLLGGFKTNYQAITGNNITSSRILGVINALDAGLYACNIQVQFAIPSPVGVINPYVDSGLLGSATAITDGSLVSSMTPIYTNFNTLGLKYSGKIYTNDAQGQYSTYHMCGCFIITNTNKNIGFYIQVAGATNSLIYMNLMINRIG